MSELRESTHALVKVGGYRCCKYSADLSIHINNIMKILIIVTLCSAWLIKVGGKSHYGGAT